MTVNSLQLYSQQSNGVTYADPLNPNMTVRFKTTSAPKMLDGLRTQNFVTEIVSNDIHNVTVGSVSAPDALSVRIRTSGSVQSHARLAQMLRDLAAKFDAAWAAENVLVGFPPVTVPQNTTV